MGEFKLVSPYQPKGDQPRAIEALAQGFRDGLAAQTLLGVTGSGKTFTMASVIEAVQRPTLIIAHNKTLAAQLFSEFRAFFPDSAVEYFVSYYDYYQPEAYIASSDTYIEKDSSINEEIDRLRHSATAALRERRDVIIVASVSCIYSMGDPSEYTGQMISLRPGMRMTREELALKLVATQYERNDIGFARGMFRIRGDVMEIIPANEKDNGIRVEFFGDEIERVSEFEVTSGRMIMAVNHYSVFPATHYASTVEGREDSIEQIERDLEAQIDYFEKQNLLLEA
ncbi:MAG: DEAD/DEAH box helicase family protein, partial [Clostridiales bacterium]|nr:DEAD/DEAH box helicase family protein [Clostridiales bacterium]